MLVRRVVTLVITRVRVRGLKGYKWLNCNRRNKVSSGYGPLNIDISLDEMN